MNRKSHNDLKDGDHFFEVLQIGIPRKPEVFLQAALEVGHPKNLLKRVRPELERAINFLVSENTKTLEELRANFLKKWLKRAMALKDQENQLHERMPKHLSLIMKGKRLLLWTEILVDLGYPDSAIIDEAIDGFSLIGWSNKSGVFETDVRAPSMSLDQLKGMAMGLNSAVVSSLKSQEWTDIDEQALEETEHEVAKGWLRHCSDINLKDHFIAKRFPLQQREKIRLIDDFSICGVNSTFGLQEKLRVETIDEMIACLLVAMDESHGHHKPKLVGRCFDLKSAYKQFGVDAYHAEHLKIALKKSRGEVAFYDVLALPFGATGSVSAFLRLASSIAFIGVAGLGLTWTVFFDDFTCVSSEKMKDNTSFYAESLFKLLGMCFAEEGPKAPPFPSTFKTLGLQLDISAWTENLFTLEHTVTRRKELEETMSEMLRARTLTCKQLERLHGRLVWFNSYIFGRSINKAVRVISKHSRKNDGSVAVGEELSWALHRLLEVVTNAQPLKISKCLSLTWIVFTDGAYEPSFDTPATIGGLIVHPQGKVVGFFGEELPKTLTDQFTSESKDPIYELELFPVLISLALWSQHIGEAHCRLLLG